MAASACQHDSNAIFDDSPLGSSGSPSSSGGSGVLAGESAGGADGGHEAGGSPPVGGKSSAGAGTTGGKPAGGHAGMAAGGTMGHAGTASAGKAGMPSGGAGSSGSAGSAGSGGSVEPPPEPLTYQTRDIEDAGIADCFRNVPLGGYSSVTVGSGSSAGPSNGGCDYRALFGVPLGNVPDSAEVMEATLSLSCTNAGDTIDVAYVDSPWQESLVTWSDRPELGDVITTITCHNAGKVSIDLTEAVAVWLAGEHENFGLYLSTEGTHSTEFVTSEGLLTDQRPLLRVVYLPR